MDRDASEPGSYDRRPVLRRTEQATIWVLVTSCFVAITLHWIWSVAFGTALIEIDEAPKREFSFQVRVNEADWPELTLLPRIGETLARRIVEHREKHGPFETVEQLQDVKGIGPKTIRRIRDHVRLD